MTFVFFGGKITLLGFIQWVILLYMFLAIFLRTMLIFIDLWIHQHMHHCQWCTKYFIRITMLDYWHFDVSIVSSVYYLKHNHISTFNRHPSTLILIESKYNFIIDNDILFILLPYIYNQIEKLISLFEHVLYSFKEFLCTF